MQRSSARRPAGRALKAASVGAKTVKAVDSFENGIVNYDIEMRLPRRK